MAGCVGDARKGADRRKPARPWDDTMGRGVRKEVEEILKAYAGSQGVWAERKTMIRGVRPCGM